MEIEIGSKWKHRWTEEIVEIKPGPETFIAVVQECENKTADANMSENEDCELTCAYCGQTVKLV